MPVLRPGTVAIDVAWCGIFGRLARRYTRDQISVAELTTRVHTSYNGFAAARIRSFVSIFVERFVRWSIETPTSKT